MMTNERLFLGQILDILPLRSFPTWAQPMGLLSTYVRLTSAQLTFPGALSGKLLIHSFLCHFKA